MVIFDLLGKNLMLVVFLDGGVSTFLSSSFSVKNLLFHRLLFHHRFSCRWQYCSLVFVGTDYLDYWFFGLLCCTNHRDDLFLGVQASFIFGIHVMKVCETRFLHLPTF